MRIGQLAVPIGMSIAALSRVTLAQVTPLSAGSPEPVTGYRLASQPTLPRALQPSLTLGRAGSFWISDLDLTYGLFDLLHLHASLPAYVEANQFRLGGPRVGLGSWLPFGLPRESTAIFLRLTVAVDAVIPNGQARAAYGASVLSDTMLRSELFSSLGLISQTGFSLTPWVRRADGTDFGASAAYTMHGGEFSAGVGVARLQFPERRETSISPSVSVRPFRGDFRFSLFASLPVSGDFSHDAAAGMELSFALSTGGAYDSRDLFEAVGMGDGDERTLDSSEDIASPTSLAVPGKVTVVEFGATWCGPCWLMKAELHKLAGAHGDIVIWSVDTDLHVDLFEKMHADHTGLPLVLVYDRSRTERARLNGYRRGQVRSITERLLSEPWPPLPTVPAGSSGPVKTP